VPGHIRIVNDPVELVPLLMTFNSPSFKKVYELLSKAWMTEEELMAQVGDDSVPVCIQVLKKGNLVEEQWRMPKPGEKPTKEYRGTYNKFRANFQCNLPGPYRYSLHLALERRESPRGCRQDRSRDGKRQHVYRGPIPQIRGKPGVHQGPRKTGPRARCERTGAGAA
jgi:transcriptional regulator, ArsR family